MTKKSAIPVAEQRIRKQPGRKKAVQDAVPLRAAFPAKRGQAVVYTADERQRFYQDLFGRTAGAVDTLIDVLTADRRAATQQEFYEAMALHCAALQKEDDAAFAVSVALQVVGDIVTQAQLGDYDGPGLLVDHVGWARHPIVFAKGDTAENTRVLFKGEISTLTKFGEQVVEGPGSHCDASVEGLANFALFKQLSGLIGRSGPAENQLPSLKCFGTLLIQKGQTPHS